jgi:hypothetical protein
MNNTFVVSGVRTSDGSKPIIDLIRHPVTKNHIACFRNFNNEESIDGYDYHEILSIRNMLTQILNEIDTREVIDELSNAAYNDSHLEDDGA